MSWSFKLNSARVYFWEINPDPGPTLGANCYWGVFLVVEGGTYSVHPSETEESNLVIWLVRHVEPLTVFF